MRNYRKCILQTLTAYKATETEWDRLHLYAFTTTEGNQLCVSLTVVILQVFFRRKRQLERRGPTHLSHSGLPGAVSVRGFPNTLIQVRKLC